MLFFNAIYDYPVTDYFVEAKQRLKKVKNKCVMNFKTGKRQFVFTE